MLDHALHLAPRGSPIAASQRFDLLGEIFEVQRRVHARRRQGTQLRCLLLGPGIVVRLVERSLEHLRHRRSLARPAFPTYRIRPRLRKDGASRLAGLPAHPTTLPEPATCVLTLRSPVSLALWMIRSPFSPVRSLPRRLSPATRSGGSPPSRISWVVPSSSSPP